MTMTNAQIDQQRRTYDRMGGAVFGDASFGFLPAFMDTESSEIHLSSYRDGHPAVIHIMDGIPETWVSEWDDEGQPVGLKKGIVAGFMRGGAFYTVDEILNKLCDA